MPWTSAVSRFLDAVWMERGLSPNTLAAYRADLVALSRWLADQRHRDQATEPRRPAGLHRLARRGRCTSALDCAAALLVPPLLPSPAARGRAARGSDRADRDAEDRPLAAEVALRGGGRVAAECTHCRRPARQPRPHDARGAVRHGPACLGTGEPQVQSAEPEPGRGTHRRQGQSRTHDPAGRGGGALAAAIFSAAAATRSCWIARPTTCSRPAAGIA